MAFLTLTPWYRLRKLGGVPDEVVLGSVLGPPSRESINPYVYIGH